LTEEEQQQSQEVDTDANRQPTLSEAGERLSQASHLADVQVARLDLRFDAAGFGYYRLWIPGDDEHVVGSV